MKTNIHILPAICILCLCACKSGNASSLNKNDVIQDTIKTFTLPAIPPMMTAPEQRADFLVKHYWDNVNFADKYLYDPNSPMRNEEFYIPVLDAMLASPLLEEIEKVRPKARRELAQKNRIGTKALNFSYTLASGAQGSLYQQQADYILLFINNPGCHACTETIDALKNAPIINRLLGQKKLTVLSIYPDEELDEWRKHLNEFPKEWINGYDKKFAIKEQQLYDLKAIPTLYLLNKEKTVLLKDATAQAIEEYLTNVELE